MTEERIQSLENLTAQHNQEIQGIYVAMREIRDTMQAFATAIIEQRTEKNQLKESVSTIIFAINKQITETELIKQSVTLLAES